MEENELLHDIEQLHHTLIDICNEYCDDVRYYITDEDIQEEIIYKISASVKYADKIEKKYGFEYYG